MGATVTRNGKTYYKGDDGKLYTDYRAARVAAEDRRNAEALQGLQDFFKRGSGGQSGYVGTVFPDPRRGVSGLSADPRVHNKPLNKDQLEALSKAQNEAIAAYDSVPGSSLPPAPGLGAPDAYGDPAERAREAEQRRMMQQYASKEYWDTEQGKAMLALGNQDRYSGQDLGGFYEAQGAVGIGSFDEVIGGLAQLDDRYKDGGDLRKWAEANKTLALLEYMKRVPQGQAPDPSQGDIRTAMEQGKFYAPENSPNPLAERSQLVSGVDPGITLGPPAGLQAQANRSQMEQIQAIIPQAAATETGDKALNMQPASAMAQGYQQPAEPLAAGNIPPSSLSPEGVSLREKYKQMIQNGANGSSYYGGRSLT